LREHVRGHVALAQEFASWVEADERFELVAPHELALVTFRLRAGDDATRALMDRVNATGQMYLTHTSVNGNIALRMAIGATLTERHHVAAAWDLLSARS
jgi:aromatic-L-amino-acid decarboxylase